jgi:demethylmenaquinone methyltransferase/2-methoxy-6-polyprenyl-1,4-benzoquinol methylase
VKTPHGSATFDYLRRPHAAAPLFVRAPFQRGGAEPHTPAAADVRRMFDAVAARYDACNALLGLGLAQWLRRRAVKLARLPEDGSLLDACTGTGDVALAARKLHPRRRIAAVDFSGGMLGRARVKLAGRGVSLIQGDCLRIPVRDQTFDAVTVAWGLRNLSDVPAGLEEMARVLKKGGRLVILEFSRPGRRYVRGAFDLCFGAYSRLVGLAAGRAADAYSYLPRSIEQFPAPARLSAMIAECGLEVESATPRLLGCLYTHVAVKTSKRATRRQ